MSERQIVRTWNVLGTNYHVVRTELDGDEEEGNCDIRGGELQVSPSVGANRFWEVESHEVGHRVWATIDMRRTLVDVFRLPAEVADKIEEECLTKFLPVLLDTLERNGCLSRPPVPVFPPAGDK